MGKFFKMFFVGIALLPLSVQAAFDVGIGPFQFRMGHPRHYVERIPVVPVVEGVATFDDAICYAIKNHKYLRIDMEQKVDKGNGVVEYRVVRQVFAPFVYGVDEQGSPILRGAKIRPGEEVALEGANHRHKGADENTVVYESMEGQGDAMESGRIVGVSVVPDSYFELSKETEVDESGMKIINCRIR